MPISGFSDLGTKIRSSILDSFANSIYNKPMGITYDPAKNERNIRERGLSFERVADFDFQTALIAEYSRLLKLGKRGPQKSPKKVPISIRLSPDVAEGLRATGNGWQGRADKALRSWLSRQTASHA